MRHTMRVVGWAIVVALSGLVAGCAPTAAPVSSCWPGMLTVSPSTAHPGDQFTVSARSVSCAIAFTHDRWYDLELDYSRWDVKAKARVRAAKDGAFTTTMRVPAGAPPGQPVVTVTDGFTTTCGAGAECAGTFGLLRVTRSSFVAPDIRALQARLDAQPQQEGRLVEIGAGRPCLALDRPWTSSFDIALPAGWTESRTGVLDPSGTLAARVGDYVRVALDTTDTRSPRPGCKTGTTALAARNLTRIAHPSSTPPGGRLIVGTDTALAQPKPGSHPLTGTLTGRRHGDYLCLSIRPPGADAQLVALPPGTTALPNGTVIDRDDNHIARLGDRVTVDAAATSASTPVGCEGHAIALAVYKVHAASQDASRETG